MPFVQEAVRIDPRIQVSEIPSQDVISRDNVSMKVDAVLYFNIVDPERAVIRVRSLPSSHGDAGANHPAHGARPGFTRRNAVGAQEAQRRPSGSPRRPDRNLGYCDQQRRNENGRAHREHDPGDCRAKIIHAEAEFQAAQPLVDAARILASIPAAMQLRYLQTLTQIGPEPNSTVIFPMPLDIVKPFLQVLEKTASAPGAADTRRAGAVPVAA